MRWIFKKNIEIIKQRKRYLDERKSKQFKELLKGIENM